MQMFFEWYNAEHYHSGIAMMTPANVHTGKADGVCRKRQAVLATAHKAHPERFVKGVPQVRGVPEEVWINKPAAA